MVKESELQEIKDYMGTIEGWKAALGYILVNKSVNARFFLNGHRNPKAGTVIDSKVTRPER
jgi:hypothetical protein